jgi:hypothetical protein
MNNKQALTPVTVAQSLIFQSNLKIHKTQPLLKQFKKTAKEPVKMFFFVELGEC